MERRQRTWGTHWGGWQDLPFRELQRTKERGIGAAS